MTRELVLDSLWLAGEMVWRDSVTAGAVLYLPGWERNGLLASRRILSNNVFWRFPPLRSNLIPGTPAQRPPHIPATSPAPSTHTSNQPSTHILSGLAFFLSTGSFRECELSAGQFRSPHQLKLRLFCCDWILCPLLLSAVRYRAAVNHN